MPLFNIAGIAISFFFIVFILSKRNHKRSDYWLILINLLMICFLAVVMLAHEKFTVTRFLLQAQLPFYLFPVFLLFALQTLEKKPNPLWLLLFLPALMTTLCIGIDVYVIHNYNTEELLHQVYNDPPFFYHLFYKGNQVFFIVALVWVLKKLEAYKQGIKASYSFIDPIDLNWLANASWTYLGITIISLITFLIANFDLLPVDARASFKVVSFCMVLLIFYLSFYGIRQYSVSEYYGSREVRERMRASAEGEVASSEKYKMSSLTSAEQDTLYKQILNLFESKTVYREPKLQLQDVADMLQVSAHTLSQTINTKAGKPFYDFVNEYRVKNLQRLLEDPTQKRFTILALGLESGFNSKASLNRVFKEHTSLSPSEYQKHHLQK